MGGRMSVEKQKRGEREVAAILEVWWNRFSPTARVYRSAQSGGRRAGGRHVLTDLGDVISDDPRFPFAVEVKRYAKVPGMDTKACRAWRTKLSKEAELGKKTYALLLTKEDRGDWQVQLGVRQPTMFCWNDRVPVSELLTEEPGDYV